MKTRVTHTYVVYPIGIVTIWGYNNNLKRLIKAIRSSLLSYRYQYISTNHSDIEMPSGFLLITDRMNLWQDSDSLIYNRIIPNYNKQLLAKYEDD